MFYLLETLVRNWVFCFYEIYLKYFSSQSKCFIFDLEIVLVFLSFSPVSVILGCRTQGFHELYKLWNLFSYDLRMHHTVWTVLTNCHRKYQLCCCSVNVLLAEVLLGAHCAFRCSCCTLSAFSLAQGSWGWWISQIKGLILFLLGVFLTWMRSRMTQVMVFCMCKENWKWVSWGLLLQLHCQEPGPGCVAWRKPAGNPICCLQCCSKLTESYLGFSFLCWAS